MSSPLSFCRFENLHAVDMLRKAEGGMGNAGRAGGVGRQGREERSGRID